MHFILRYFAKRRGGLKHNAQHNLIDSILKSGLLLTIVFILHIGLMMHYEGLSLGDATWLTLTTATTVGYGDIRPMSRLSKALSVMIALVGMVFTGIMVALAVNAVSEAYKILKPDF